MFRESNTPYFIRSTFTTISFFLLGGFILFNLLAQHVLRVSSVGAEPLSFKLDIHCDNLVAGKGIEPHPTNGVLHMDNLSIDT